MGRLVNLLVYALVAVIAVPIFLFLHSFLKAWKAKGLRYAAKRSPRPDIQMSVSILTSLIVIGLASEANREGAGLLRENAQFLESAKSINRQAEDFQRKSMESFRTLNLEAKTILAGAAEMNKGSRDFLVESK